jgi:hypothetical protein
MPWEYFHAGIYRLYSWWRCIIQSRFYNQHSNTECQCWGIFSLQLCILLQPLLYKYIILINWFFLSRPFWISKRSNSTVQIPSPSQHHFLKNNLNRRFLQMKFWTKLNWWAPISFICNNILMFFWSLVICYLIFNFPYTYYCSFINLYIYLNRSWFLCYAVVTGPFMQSTLNFIE